MTCRVGIDIGGTFTDFALLGSAGNRLVISKRLTTPQDPSEAVLSGLPVLLEKAGAAIGDVEAIVHGTTLVTNAIIERRGAPTAMICTEGFGDVLEIARERRYDMYDLASTYPKPLVPKRLRGEVRERIGADGGVLTPLDPDDARQSIRRLVEERGAEALAVCLLNSPANRTHEDAIAALAAEMYPHLYICTSADILPFMREYERWTTATMNAYVGPMFGGYLDRLEGGLAEQGFRGALYIMSSSGGMMAPEAGRRYPVRLLESGPAAGVLQTANVGKLLGIPDLLSFDMGGTTAKGALVRGGAPLKRYEMEVARVHDFKMGSGLPAKIPVIDLIEIGAGGGSIAAINARGTIQVGPKSAGADPGPVCYGLGGSDPTLTDANLTLGYLDADFFLGGEMPLDATAVGEALAMGVGRPLQVSEERAAWGIHESVNEDISRAFRNHASERGFDYRACVMVAFGGSGPAHACRVARKLRVPTVIFPPAAGVMSAVGLLSTPLSFETFRSGRVELSSLTPEAFEARFAPLIDEALSLLKLGDAATGDVTITRRLDMRYRGQGYELEVPLPDLPAREVLRALPDLYTGVYEQVFAKSFPAEPLEIINWKVEASVPLAGLSGTPRLDAANGGNALKGKRKAYEPVSGRFVDTPVYDRYALGAGDRLEGPALIEERESTGLIGAGDSARVDGHGNLVVTIAGTA